MVVEVDGEGHLGLAYDKLTAVLVHAVQEEHAARRAADDGLEKKVEGLRKENERQQTQIDELRKQNAEVQLRETEMMGHIKELWLLMIGGHSSAKDKLM